MNVLRFTSGEVEAILHRLDICECIEECFEDTEELKHLAALVIPRALEMQTMLRKTHNIVSSPENVLDREILRDCLDGSTWYAVHEGYGAASDQKLGAVVRALKGAAAKIEKFYGIPDGDIETVTW